MQYIAVVFFEYGLCKSALLIAQISISSIACAFMPEGLPVIRLVNEVAKPS